jgi:hypothetical protein
MPFLNGGSVTTSTATIATVDHGDGTNSPITGEHTDVATAKVMVSDETSERSQVGLLYELFWSRITYLLTGEGKWMDCDEAKEAANEGRKQYGAIRRLYARRIDSVGLTAFCRMRADDKGPE